MDRFFADHRVAWANVVTDVLCTLAGTFGAAALALVAVGWTRWRCGRWREPAFIAFCVLLELAVFLITTAVVHRPRPHVSELDASPPTSSFPSGHTAAAVALYGAVALLLSRRTGRKAPWLLLLMPGAVAIARLYRGMHHPSDVLAGALLGWLCVWAAERCVLRGTEPARSDPRPPVARFARLSGSARQGDVLIVNAAKADAAAADLLLARYADLCARHRRPAPRLRLTTAQEHGAGLAAAAVRDGAGLVVACGGDGTVNAVAESLVGTDVTLGVIPLGTGNLLAANLGIPTDTDEALAVLADGLDRRIDVGRIDGRIFLGMAGTGLDAAMIEDAPERLKRRAGWAAYAVAVIRHLPDRIRSVSVEVDGRRSRHRDVSTLLVGNFGRIQAGLEPHPGAQIDDGLLDLVVICPRGPFAWLRVGAALRHGDAGRRSRVAHHDRGRHIRIRMSQPESREADGEPLPAARDMDVHVWPAALRIRVARPTETERQQTQRQQTKPQEAVR